MLLVPKPIYNRIKAVLAEAQRTNVWLARQLGKNETTVSKWCRNESQPRLETLFSIAKELNVEVRMLIRSNKEL